MWFWLWQGFWTKFFSQLKWKLPLKTWNRVALLTRCVVLCVSIYVFRELCDWTEIIQHWLLPLCQVLCGGQFINWLENSYCPSTPAESIEEKLNGNDIRTRWFCARNTGTSLCQRWRQRRKGYVLLKIELRCHPRTAFSWVPEGKRKWVPPLETWRRAVERALKVKLKPWQRHAAGASENWSVWKRRVRSPILRGNDYELVTAHWVQAVTLQIRTLSLKHYTILLLLWHEDTKPNSKILKTGKCQTRLEN